ncbi:hypothetical protein TcCL_Unassigned01643 [Trypanosoma cruzi]|nr:hypothetical protein TcCL_Unassigned01643 [Trypanosoma cruzi]
MRGRGWQPPMLTPPHTFSPTTFPHTKGQGRGEEKPAVQRTQKHRHPRRSAKKSHAHSTPTAATRGTGRTQGHGAVLYFPPPRRIGSTPTAGCGGWRPTPTVRHSAHHLLPSKCTQQAGTRRPVNLLPSQRKTKTIVAGRQCL